MWSEEYQVEFLRGYLDVAARKPFVIGAHVWNFADFQAAQSMLRVDGMNLKGVFTRDRRPKMAAHFLRERWLTRAARIEEAIHQDELVEAAYPTHAPFPMDASFGEIFAEAARRLNGKYPGMDRTLAFRLGDEGDYSLVIADGIATISRTINPTADATVRLKPQDARKLLTGRLKPLVALTLGKVKVSGDIKALAILQDLL
jgi:putative sterol carrier protein